MTLVKIDHPRRIDQFLDYFGGPRRAGDARPYGGVTVEPREPRRGEAADERVMTAHAFSAPV